MDSQHLIISIISPCLSNQIRPIFFSIPLSLSLSLSRSLFFHAHPCLQKDTPKYAIPSHIFSLTFNPYHYLTFSWNLYFWVFIFQFSNFSFWFSFVEIDEYGRDKKVGGGVAKGGRTEVL